MMQKIKIKNISVSGYWIVDCNISFLCCYLFVNKNKKVQNDIAYIATTAERIRNKKKYY